MAEYKLEVTTGGMEYAGTLDYVYITLFGTEGQSDRRELDSFGLDFQIGTTGTYTLRTTSSLGKLLLLKVEKEPLWFLPEDEWFCSKVVVKTPEGEIILFPCHRWVSRGERVELRGGKAMKVFEEEHPLLVDHRNKELTLKKTLYGWKESDGLPHVSHFKDLSELPTEVRVSASKTTEILQSRRWTGFELKFKGLLGSTEQWENFEDMKKIFWTKQTTMLEYVSEHWKEDGFYGFQFLNGFNPNVIKRCAELPPNFPVTEEMVKPFLNEGTSLQKEMEKGNIFLCDQKRVDGIPTQTYEGDSLHVAAGFCLFYMNPENKLMPIAIQLQQQPSEQNPIFLPSDSESDWLLAKMFIKNTDSMEHQAVHHLMNTHFLAEVFAVATLRCFPNIHPLYKLLMPHFRHTLHINILAHKTLFSPAGVLSASSLGYDGLVELMRRAHRETTYSSLCLPENITARGLESIPNFYYRDDGLKLWSVVSSFVKAVVEYYYPSDSEVCSDSELQEWISEIFTHGFLGNKASGIPASFHTVEDLIKFITMVIFTASAQHAAVNSGQFDYYAWTPNCALLLRKAPPTTKGQSSMESILETLPNVGETVTIAAMVWLLSAKYSDFVPLGSYPVERFDEAVPNQLIEEFQAALSSLSAAIVKRNSELVVPYTYLNPSEIENSVSM